MAGRRSKTNRFKGIKLSSAFAAGLALLASSLVFSPPAQAALINGCDPSASPLGAGAGTTSDPFLICSRTQLKAVETNLSSHYRLASNINLTGAVWAPITGIFTGSLDGGFHSIANMNIDGSTGPTLGLFERLGNGSVVKKLRLSDSTIQSVDADVNAAAGTLAGRASGTVELSEILVENSTITGTPIYAGGLVGDSSLADANTRLLDTRLVKLTGVSITSGRETIPVSLGGLVGRSASVSIDRSAVDASITNSALSQDIYANLGGLVG